MVSLRRTLHVQFYQDLAACPRMTGAGHGQPNGAPPRGHMEVSPSARASWMDMVSGRPARDAAVDSIGSRATSVTSWWSEPMIGAVAACLHGCKGWGLDPFRERRGCLPDSMAFFRTNGSSRMKWRASCGLPMCKEPDDFHGDPGVSWRFA